MRFLDNTRQYFDNRSLIDVGDYHVDIYTYVEPIEIEIFPVIFSRSRDYRCVSRVLPAHRK